MHIAVAGDHTAVAHTRAIIAHLQKLGHTVEDFGTTSESSCDYPDYAGPACESIVNGNNERAILVCGSGIGVSIVANKVKGIRCGLAHNIQTAQLAREHNNAHALALGARFVAIDTAIAMVDAYINATFEARHLKRLDKIAAREGCSLPINP